MQLYPAGFFPFFLKISTETTQFMNLSSPLTNQTGTQKDVKTQTNYMNICSSNAALAKLLPGLEKHDCHAMILP